MKLYALAACAGTFGLAALAVAGLQTADVDPIVSGSIAPGSVREYSLSNITDKTACMVERGPAVTNRSRAFHAPADCDGVWPGLASAKTWTENEDGTVVLSNAGGQQILTVAAESLLSFVSMEPPGASITLLAIN